MARPKKSLNEPNARERIIESFWVLLEENHISKIGIKAINSAANCNRATFYYHFTDIYDLLHEAIAAELMGSGSLSQVIFAILSQQNFEDVINKQLLIPRKRIATAMRHGGANTVQEIVCEEVCRMWCLVLCCREEELSPKAQFLIRYAACGMMGALFQGNEDDSVRSFSDVMPADFMYRAVPILVESICDEQNVSIDDVRPRLAMINSLSSLDLDPSALRSPHASA